MCRSSITIQWRDNIIIQRVFRKPAKRAVIPPKCSNHLTECKKGVGRHHTTFTSCSNVVCSNDFFLWRVYLFFWVLCFDWVNVNLSTCFILRRLDTWNGAGFFLSTSWMDSDSLTLHTDASGTLGYGGILGNKWFQGQWETHQQLNAPGISIAWQGLFALVVACHIWTDEFANKRIVFYCDNASVVSIVNSKQSRIPRVMDLVWHLTLLTLRHNFYRRERHIEGKKNDIADSLPFSDGPLLQPGPRCWPSPMSCVPSALGDLNANIQVSARGFTGFVGPIRVKNKKMFF